MSMSKKAYKIAKKQFKDMPWWIEIIWWFNLVIMFYGRDKSSNGRPRG